MRKALIILAFALALVPLASAHEGHAKKVMGTVAAIDGDHLEITTSPGKSSTIMLNDKTKIMRGKATHKAGDIKVGDRVVITAADVKDKDGKIMWVAKQVSLGSAPATAAKK